MGESKRKRMLVPMTATGASPITDLPDHLIHNILSFLPMQTASKLCILSKRFYSAWNSIPSLSFHHSGGDDNYSSAATAKRNRFIHYVHSTLARRTPGVSLEEFRIQATDLPAAASPDTAYHDQCVDAAIDYALSRGVRVLDLELGTGQKFGRYYLFRSRILTAANTASLTALRLSGFELEPGGRPPLLVNCPLLADLTLNRTSAIEKLEISCPKLKSLCIDSCVGLKSLTLDSQTSNLESFSFTGTRDNRKDDINPDGAYDLKISAACPYLTRISVSKVLVPGGWAADMASKQRSLESLKLTKFEPLDGAVELFGHENLQLIEMEIWSGWVVGVRIGVPNLQTLKLSYKKEQYCSREFDVLGCGSLEKLELRQVWITGEWIEANIPNLEWLKCLDLKYCGHLEGIKVHHQRLESLVMNGCNKVKTVDIVATSLAEFKYSSSLIPHEIAMGTSGRLLATLGLPSGVFDNNNACFAQWSSFLKSFGQCRELTLVASCMKDLTIDASLRQRKTAPMYDLRSLEVEIKSGLRLWKEKMGSSEIVTLVDSLLWLAPRVNLLSLLFPKKRRTLKLSYYAQREPKDKDVLPCCETWWPIKCWRHTLQAVTMENFEPEEKVDLVNFFRWSAPKLEAVYDD